MEFLDFQCPYCKRQHTDNVLNEPREVEFPGKVRTAAVNFPLTGKRHELATQAAESAQCAFMQ
jgi:protein-disulfide isomerase